MISRTRLLAVPFVLLAAPLAAQDKAPEVKYIVPTGAAATLPFSPAVRVGHMLYLSGQLGTDSTNRLVAGGIEAETRQTMLNIKRVLEANGSGMDRIMKETRRELPARPCRKQSGVDGVAGSKTLGAARMEAAAAGDRGRIGQLTGQKVAPPAATGNRYGDRIDQRLRVRVLRSLDDVGSQALLDHPSHVHDADSVAKRPRETQVVGDEEKAEPAALA